MEYIGDELKSEKVIGISMKKLELQHQAAIKFDIRKKAEHDRREISRKIEQKRRDEEQEYQRQLTVEMKRLVEQKLSPDKPWTSVQVEAIISEAEKSRFSSL